MRLLNVHSLQLTEFGDSDRPRYVIASHRWVHGFEATFQSFAERRNTDGVGYEKVEAFARYVKESFGHIEWIWIDTVCINKESAAELSESVNLMFEWYRKAEFCIAYLADVENVEDKSEFAKSEWFKRGWTLQELLAPQTVLFVTKTWHIIGCKGAFPGCLREDSKGLRLEQDLARITNVPDQVLYDYNTSLSLPVEDRLAWMDGRATTREEDQSYALFGIFGVSPGANYGERREGARQRLHTAIKHRASLVEGIDHWSFPTHGHRQTPTVDFGKIMLWISPPDPWTNHESARQRHEPQTGAWFLKSEQYHRWKAGSVRHLCIYGKAGCGKTILCSTIIEDIRQYCDGLQNVAYAMFYFSFSDIQKKTAKDLIRALTTQLATKGNARKMLNEAYREHQSRPPGVNDLMPVLLSAMESYEQVFLIVDALDECPEQDDVRQDMLRILTRLVSESPNLRVLATTRDIPEIRAAMDLLHVNPVSVVDDAVNADVQRYVASQISQDRKLSRLDPGSKALIEETISRKADGMFRWAYCQLQELKKSKSTKPRSVAAALKALPKTLDETYERMLAEISDEDRSDAVTLLRWLAYAKRPLSLGELVEVTIILPGENTSDDHVEIENRGDWMDTLEILAGLATIEGTDELLVEQEFETDGVSNHQHIEPRNTTTSRRLDSDTKIKLAHFSVKEFLESRRITSSGATSFSLDLPRDHAFLAKSCLVYLLHWTESPQKAERHDMFPLLNYAAKSWLYHCRLQHSSDIGREVRLLSNKGAFQDWLSIYTEGSPIHGDDHTGIYYASYFGLAKVARSLLVMGFPLEMRPSNLGAALCAAARQDYEDVVRTLVAGGVEVDSGDYSALYEASRDGRVRMVRTLIDLGAYVDIVQEGFETPLFAASEQGHVEVVRTLVDAGADVNLLHPYFGTALCAASAVGHKEMVSMLIEAGANANDRGWYKGFEFSPLVLASARGYKSIVRMLKARGAQK